MAVVHVDVEDGKHDDFEEEIHPWTVQYGRQREHDGAGVERQDVGEWHERTATVEQLPRDVGGKGGIALLHLLVLGEEGLELGGAHLLIPAIVAVELMEKAGQPLFARKVVGNGLLGGAVVEFAALAAQKEIEVYLTVIVGERRLWNMHQEPGNGRQHPDADAPAERHEGDELVLQTEHEGQVDGKEPDVARDAVEYSADERLLIGEAGQLPVGGVAEIGQHEQQGACHIVGHIGEIEHHAGSNAEEDAQYGNRIGGDAQLLPHQGKGKAYGPVEMNVQPFFCFVRLERTAEKLVEFILVHNCFTLIG